MGNNVLRHGDLDWSENPIKKDKYMRLRKVISGGQNGVDQAALRAAQELSISTGGWMPKGWATLDGPRPDFAGLYDMTECYGGYKARTEANVIDADATLIFARTFKSPGEICTFRAIQHFRKPYFRVEATTMPLKEVLGWLEWNGFVTLNVAGNSNNTVPGIGDEAYLFLYEMLRRAITHSAPVDIGIGGAIV